MTYGPEILAMVRDFVTGRLLDVDPCHGVIPPRG
jgi:hypothetical protein